MGGGGDFGRVVVGGLQDDATGGVKIDVWPSDPQIAAEIGSAYVQRGIATEIDRARAIAGSQKLSAGNDADCRQGTRAGHVQVAAAALSDGDDTRGTGTIGCVRQRSGRADVERACRAGLLTERGAAGDGGDWSCDIGHTVDDTSGVGRTDDADFTKRVCLWHPAKAPVGVRVPGAVCLVEKCINRACRLELAK